MDLDTFTAPQYATSDPSSFAHTSARERWPIIITQGIDDVHRSTSAASDPAVVQEGKEIVSQLARLKYELQHDRELAPIADDGGADVSAYNEELAARGTPRWHGVEWLFAECYLYRCVRCLYFMERVYEQNLHTNIHQQESTNTN